jgi:hypothetical protein
LAVFPHGLEARATKFRTAPFLTLDHDFRLYRKSGGRVVPVIMPGGF